MPRQQKVTNTSRISFIKNADSIRTQRQIVAEFILAETRAGRWTWISKIAENAQNLGCIGLSQKSSAGRALNDLKRSGPVILEGQEWVLNKGIPFRPNGCRTKIEPWCFILKSASEKDE